MKKTLTAVTFYVSGNLSRTHPTSVNIAIRHSPNRDKRVGGGDFF